MRARAERKRYVILRPLEGMLTTYLLTRAAWTYRALVNIPSCRAPVSCAAADAATCRTLCGFCRVTGMFESVSCRYSVDRSVDSANADKVFCHLPADNLLTLRR